ncbi:MAG: SCP2 sterol-binding domain-containing protein [Solirubrobacteraceae bacterium]
MNLETIISEIKSKALTATPLGTTIKFDLGEVKVFVDGTAGSNEVSTEDKEAACTISLSEADFISLVKKELNPMNAFMGGKLKIKGDMGVAMKLQNLF